MDCCGYTERAHQRRRSARRLLLPGPPRVLRAVLRNDGAVLSGAGGLRGDSRRSSPASRARGRRAASRWSRRSAARSATPAAARRSRRARRSRWGRCSAARSRSAASRCSGTLVGGGVAGLREGLGAAIALAAAVADWRGVRIAPQIRRQVPERWRWTLPLPLACALYGVLLGPRLHDVRARVRRVGARGHQLRRRRPARSACVVGLAFGAGRALPVLWMAPGLRGGAGARRLDEMAERAAPVARAAPARRARARRVRAGAGGRERRRRRGATRALAQATDPSAAGGALAWQQLGGGRAALAERRRAARAARATHPALGGSTSRGRARRRSRSPTAPRCSRSWCSRRAASTRWRVSDGWVVYRDAGRAGRAPDRACRWRPERAALPRGLRAWPGGSAARRSTARSVVFTLDTPRRSAIELVDLASGRRRTLRAAQPRCRPSSTRRCSAGGCCSSASRAACSSCADRARSRARSLARRVARSRGNACC